MGTAIVITSGKGGTGKTACTAAIGSFLARSGSRTLCVDMDAALRNLDMALGLAERVSFDYGDILSGRVSPEEAVTAHPSLENLYFLSAPTELPDEAEAEGFSALIGTLRDAYDFVLLDSPAGIGRGFRMAARGADMAIVVATGDLASLRDGQRTVQELKALGVEQIRLLVNRVRPRAYRKINRNLDDVIDTVGARLIGIISEDESVAEAGNLETPLIAYGARRAWGQFENVAARLRGEKVRLARF